MHPISLIFLGLCAFLLGFGLVRWLERRRLRSSNASVPSTTWPDIMPADSVSGTARQLAALTSQHKRAVQELLSHNRKVEAIKYVREQTGWSLAQAKTYVEQTVPAIRETDLSAEVVTAIRQLIAEKQTIAAIKLVRHHTGWGLKQAKKYVESLSR